MHDQRNGVNNSPQSRNDESDSESGTDDERSDLKSIGESIWSTL